jgi:predicted transcriptional regulator
MAASAVSLQLDPAIQERVERLAEARHRTKESVLCEAVEDYVTRAEKREEFRQNALAASEHYRTTGLHLTQEEVEEWMLKFEAGEDAPMPECHV